LLEADERLYSLTGNWNPDTTMSTINHPYFPPDILLSGGVFVENDWDVFTLIAIFGAGVRSDRALEMERDISTVYGSKMSINPQILKTMLSAQYVGLANIYAVGSHNGRYLTLSPKSHPQAEQQRQRPGLMVYSLYFSPYPSNPIHSHSCPSQS
jgi:hypothetical protein